MSTGLRPQCRIFSVVARLPQRRTFYGWPLKAKSSGCWRPVRSTDTDARDFSSESGSDQSGRRDAGVPALALVRPGAAAGDRQDAVEVEMSFHMVGERVERGLDAGLVGETRGCPEAGEVSAAEGVRGKEAVQIGA